jgi:RHS repeat-associated protein
LRRAYNSQGSTGPFGVNWSHSYNARIQQVSSTSVQVIRADQKTLTFTLTNGLWLSTPDINSTLVPLTDMSGTFAGWRYTTGADDVETYNATGALLSITTRAGLAQTLRYNAQGMLASVTDPSGVRSLTFAYDANNRVRSITDPASGAYTYTYDANNNLQAVTGPDGQTRTYFYEDATLPNALTGLQDENGDRFATWAYDSQGRVMSSEHAGGADKVTVNYDNGMTRVTDALGATRSYTYVTQFGVARTMTATKPGTEGGTATASWDYDANGNIKTYIDYRGHRTDFTYDLTRNLETQRIEAHRTPQERTITTEWHATFRLPTRLAEPLRITTYDYDEQGTTCGARGALCHLTIQATTDTTGAQGFTAAPTGNPRNWSYTYNSSGQVLTVDGPRTDVPDITTYMYDLQGNLSSRMDALGHTTTVPTYDTHGRPRRIVDPNGLATFLDYDQRGRMVSRLAGGERTTYMYDSVGQLSTVTRTDGSFLRFMYDPAHRLSEIHDNLGNRIVYTPDAAGNITQEQAYDPQGGLQRTQRRIPDILSRVLESRDAQDQATQYGYDDNDNLTQMIDPLRHSARWDYDALDRLDVSTDLNGFLTFYGYDAGDRLMTVFDPLGRRTGYLYNGLDDLLHTQSPETNATDYTYDEAGNERSRTDARGPENGQTASSYDALNRLKDITFADGKTALTSNTVVFTYDQGPNGIGHLTQMTDSTETTRWEYDVQRRVFRKTQQFANLTLVTQYSYDLNGRLFSITYPSGQRMQLTYTEGQATQVSVNGSVLLRNIQYQPFGPARTWVWGDGRSYNRQFDLNGRIMAYDLGGGRSRELHYDPASRVMNYLDTDPTHNQAFGYDAAGALTAFSNGDANQTTYMLDANGNRTILISAQGTDHYTYDPASNRLLSIEGAHPVTYHYDDAGNIISDGTNQFIYDGRSRLIQVNNAQGTTQYQINGLGQRVAKFGAQTGSYFVYDEAGHLLGEYTLQGQPVQETVYLGDMPVAVLKDGMHFFVYADHLNAPRAIVDTSGTVVWRWEGDPFGATPPDEDPDGNGTTFTYNLRFPGQYFDQETGLVYNYFRNYDPKTGHYIQPDPIGLAGGLNLYTYVAGNPVADYDPYGLSRRSCAESIEAQAGSYDPVSRMGVQNLGIFGYGEAGPGTIGLTALTTVGTFVGGMGAAYGAVTLPTILGGAGEAVALARMAFQRFAPVPFIGSIFSGLIAGGQRIALGVSEHLERFARSVGATTWSTWGGDNWRESFMRLARDSQTQILFNLADPRNKMINAWQAIAEAARNPNARATSWELLQIYQNPEWWSRVTFYFRGAVVRNPFVPK